MAEQRPRALNRRTGQVAARPPAAVALTAKDVFGILRRHMLLIIILTALGLAGGGGACMLLRKVFPKYTARTFIEVLPPLQKDPMNFLTPTVQKDIRYGHRLSIANLIKQQSNLQKLLERQTVRDSKWYAKAGNLARRVKHLNKNMGAFAHRDADYIEVSMTCSKATEAAAIVNEMVAMFISSQKSSRQREVTDKLVEFDQQREKVEREVVAAEAALEQVRQTSQFFDLEMPTSRYNKDVVALKLDQLELEKNGLLLAIKQLQADIEVFDELATGVIGVQVEHAIENDPIMLALAQQLAFTHARHASILTKFGENHREVRQIQELKDELEARRAKRKLLIAEQTRQANLRNAQNRLTVFQARYEELDKLREIAAGQKKDLDRARVLYEQRMKIRDERIAMLDQIKMSIEKLYIIHDDPETSKVRPLGDAPKPLEMVFSRQWWVWFPSGTVMGFLLSVGLAFLIELANDLVRTPRDVSRYLHIPLLGVVPDAAEDREVRGVDLCRVVSQAPYSLTSESYRRCRTNLKLSGSGESLKTLLVTSGSPGDGKTSVAVNLATAFVAGDKRVLLIDANFRQPTTEKLFPRSGSGGVDSEGLGVGFGLSSLLVGQCGAAEAIRSSGIEGLDIIDAGLVPPNPAELLGSVRMAELLSDQRESYDYVLIDSPPVLLMSDAKILAATVDGTLLVFNASVTRRGAAQRTIRELEEVDANLVGCVLLGAPTLKGGYFQEQFRSYRKYQEKLQLAGA